MNTATERPRRSTGHVMEPGDGYLPNGNPDLSPTAGYENTKPIQYSDESDTQYAARLAMWTSSYATAKQIEAGGPTLASQKEALKARYEADLLALEAADATRPKSDLQMAREASAKVADKK